MLRKVTASSDVPSNESKLNTSTASDKAAAIAMAGAPRTTISFIACLTTKYDLLSKIMECIKVVNENKSPAQI